MIGFITENIGTIIVSLILIAVVFFAVRSMIRSKKKGQCSCGGNCGSCSMGCACHKKQ
ncbi:MAG: FeoB-associated Cys-rich membrane protein [Lachnospiraceae bacterium]|nr:FeoB-associated Cys-rich membrane protein [Lachnospiraceae bacterium]